MSRQTFVYCPEQGRVVPKGAEAAPAGRVAIHSDFSEPLMNPSDGQTYSTRRAYEAATRRAGGVEIGRTEMMALRRRIAEQGGPSVGRQSVTQTIKRALEQHGG